MKSTVLLTALGSLLFCSCLSTTMKVEANAVEGVDYSAYKTYEWVPLDSKALDNFTEKDKAVRAAFVGEVDGIMSRRGFTKVQGGNPDLFVYARGARMPGYRSVGQGPAYDARYVPSGAGIEWLSATNVSGGDGYLQASSENSIRFLISEPVSDKVVWRGKALVGLDNNRSEALVKEDAKQLARKLLKGFPPKN